MPLVNSFANDSAVAADCPQLFQFFQPCYPAASD